MSQFTVFAVYEQDYQPYAATVEADTPEGAVLHAQMQCWDDNGLPYDSVACCLIGFQVVAGKVEVIPVDDSLFIPDYPLD